MHSLRLAFAATALLLATTPALAHPTSAVRRDDLPSPPPFTGGDWAGAFLAGEAGLAVGTAVGAGLGLLAAGTCYESDAPDDGEWHLFGPCAFHGLAEASLGILLVAPPTIAGGVTLYGSASGHHGSYWGALAGSYLGSAAAVGVIALGSDADSDALSVFAALTLPAFGATLGYYLSRDTGDEPERCSGALLDVGADGAVRVGVPAIGVARGESDTVVSIGLVGGVL